MQSGGMLGRASRGVRWRIGGENWGRKQRNDEGTGVRLLGLHEDMIHGVLRLRGDWDTR